MQQQTMKRKGIFIILFISISFIMFQGTATAKAPVEIARLEQGLLPKTLVKGEKPWTLAERMMVYKVPGVSIAVVKDFNIHWAKGFGFKDIASRQPVSAETLFQAASISKPVTAMAALYWVEKGKLALDTNVNDYLHTWKLPDNDWTKKTPVTLSMLLSHSAGLTVHGFRGYAANEPVPTLVQVLNGTPPANSAAIRVDSQPGITFRYSGGGFTILQMMLIDTLRQPFPVIMKKTVLKPLGMAHSGYLQPLPPEKANTAASGHLASGMVIAGKYHTYPEMAAAGLWTTAGDLARFFIEIQLSLKGKSNAVLSQQMTQQMLSSQYPGQASLGLFNTWKGDQHYFGHNGGNEGFRCIVTVHADKGYGAAIMTNSDNGYGLYNEIINGIANIYKWDKYLKTPYERVTLSEDKLNALRGVYSIDSDHMAVVSATKGKLFIRVTSRPEVELIPVAGGTFVRLDSEVVYSFGSAEKSAIAQRMHVNNNGVERNYPRMDDSYKTPLEWLLAGNIDAAVNGYRDLFKRNPQDRNIDGMRLLYLVENLMGKAKIREALAVLHLTAGLYPQLMKKMVPTLNNELRLLMRSPMIPDAAKKQVKDSYNSMLKKLGMKELD